MSYQAHISAIQQTEACKECMDIITAMYTDFNDTEETILTYIGKQPFELINALIEHYIDLKDGRIL